MKIKFRKVFGLGLILGVAAIALTACSGQKQGTQNSNKSSKDTVALITDGGGVDDHSFNQAAWSGIQKYGKEHGLHQGNGGFQYFQSNNASDYQPNIDQAVNAGYQTIFGVGYTLKDAISSAATKYPKKNFVIIDETISGKKNVVSANFKSNQAAYLAGVAAAYETKTNTVGFVGGTHGDVIDLFDAGFTQGVKDTAKKLNKKITILNQYVGNFTSTDKAKSIAQSMYAKKADIVFPAAGAAGDGVFQEAKDINQTKPAKDKVWVIGVDIDQSPQGAYMAKGGQKANFTLTSVLTGLPYATYDIANKALSGNFPGGKHLYYGLQHDGVSITPGQINSNVWKHIQEDRQDIIDGKINVASHPEK